MWERVNLKAFGQNGLDLWNALVRVEFLMLLAGCEGKTFREVKILNPRVSVIVV